MPVSTIAELREVILAHIRRATRGDWKVLVTDEASSKALDNVVKVDDILNENITSTCILGRRRRQIGG
jgi:syntaxin-binding protein 1